MTNPRFRRCTGIAGGPRGPVPCPNVAVEDSEFCQACLTSGQSSEFSAPERASVPATGDRNSMPQREPTILEQNESLAEMLLTDGPAPLPVPATTSQDELLKQIGLVEKEALLEEVRERNELARAREEARRTGKPMRPISAAARSTMPDESVAINSDGQPAGTPGYYYRWARLTDPDGKPTRSRVDELRHHGLRIVTDPQTGKAITSRFGVLMEGPPEAEGRRRAHHARRIAMSQSDAESGLEEAVDSINREMGRKAVSTFSM